MCRDVAGGMSCEAAWRAHGFGSRNSTRFFKRPAIAQRVEELRREFNEAAAIHLRYIQEKLLSLASSDITNYFEQNQWGSLRVKRNLAELPPEMRSAINGLKIDKNGRVEVKLESKAHAIDTLLKTLPGALAAGKLEVTGKDGGAFETLTMCDGIGVDDKRLIIEGLKAIEQDPSGARNMVALLTPSPAAEEKP
jgi:hypothetical protein